MIHIPCCLCSAQPPSVVLTGGGIPAKKFMKQGFEICTDGCTDHDINLWQILEPGDLLVYGPKGWLDLFNQVTIRRTAWGYGCHVEIYHGPVVDKECLDHHHGDGWFSTSMRFAYSSLASRNGLGIHTYPFRREQLIAVRRPINPINYNKARLWYHKVEGQKYDWLGLLCFTYAVRSGSKDRMFCSEFATRFYRHGGVSPVQDWMDADTVSPNDLLKSMSFRTIWEAEYD